MNGRAVDFMAILPTFELGDRAFTSDTPKLEIRVCAVKMSQVRTEGFGNIRIRERVDTFLMKRFSVYLGWAIALHHEDQ